VTKLDKEKPYALKELFRDIAEVCQVHKDLVLPLKNYTDSFGDIVTYCALRVLDKIAKGATREQPLSG
jgi:hypothetical protein